MRLLTAIVTLWLALLPRLALADTSSPAVPAAYYPAGLKLVYQAQVSNQLMDSWWGHDEAGQPFMHVTPQAELQRRSGWLQYAYHRHGQSYIFFALAVSEYGTIRDGRQGNTTAFVDWQAAVAGLWGLYLARGQPSGIVPAGITGNAQTRILRADDGGPTVTTAAWLGGFREVEALVIFSPDMMSLTKARHLLVNQVRYAVRLPTPQP